MKTHTSIALASAFIAVSLHADTLSSLISSLSDAPHAAHVPAFSAARESFTFASDGKAQEFWTIKDGDRYNNPDAVDRSRFKRTDVMEGGFVAMGPDADGRAIALAHLKKGPYAINNNTCNMWADSHNYLVFEDKPNADGLYYAEADWRFLEIPAPVFSSILEKTEMDNMGHE